MDEIELVIPHIKHFCRPPGLWVQEIKPRPTGTYLILAFDAIMCMSCGYGEESIMCMSCGYGDESRGLYYSTLVLITSSKDRIYFYNCFYNQSPWR